MTEKKVRPREHVMVKVIESRFKMTSKIAHSGYKAKSANREEEEEEEKIQALDIQKGKIPTVIEGIVSKVGKKEEMDVDNNEIADHADSSSAEEAYNKRAALTKRTSSRSSNTAVENDYHCPTTRWALRKSCKNIKRISDEKDVKRHKGISGETQVGRKSSSTLSSSSIKRRKSSGKRKTSGSTKLKSSQHKQRKIQRVSPYQSLFPECCNHGKDDQDQHRMNHLMEGRLCVKDIKVTDKKLGEGQIGMVFVGFYRGLSVACKTKRRKVNIENYESQVMRELAFAAKLSVCKYMNRYVGWFKCPQESTEDENEDSTSNNNDNSICIVQKYIPNGDSRKYIFNRTYTFKPFEVLQATICLFTALRDAHSIDIGIVDLKLENFLIDSAGSGWITDFGSCVEFQGEDVIYLEDHDITWTTHVASPEMRARKEFEKASDVFMATLIAAELMTGTLTDDLFQDLVLRRQPNGQVNFSHKSLNKEFEAFFPILIAGLKNNPDERPTADQILKKLLDLRDKSFIIPVDE